MKSNPNSSKAMSAYRKAANRLVELHKQEFDELHMEERRKVGLDTVTQQNEMRKELSKLSYTEMQALMALKRELEK